MGNYRMKLRVKHLIFLILALSFLTVEAQIYFRVHSPDVIQQEQSFTRYTIDPGVLVFDSGSNTVTESGGVYTLSIAGGEIWNEDDYLDAPGFTIPSASDFVLIARVITDACPATCDNWKSGWMIRDDIAAPGSQMYYWTRIEAGLRHTIRSTLDGIAANDTPNPSSSTEPLPFWIMLRCDRDVPSCRSYYYPFGSDPGTDPNINWTFDRELTDTDFGVSWVDTGDIFALLAVTPNDSLDLGETATSTFDNISVTFPALDHAAPAPPIVGLSATSYSVNEDAGPVTLTITRTGSGAGTLAVDYTTSDGTAVAGTDYTTKSGQCNWTDSETGTCATADAGDEFVVTITDRDGVAQGNTQFTGTISISSGSDTLATSVATVTISDQDQGEDPVGFPTQTPSYEALIYGVAGFGADWGDLSLQTWHFCEVATATVAALNACIETTWTGCRLVYFSTSGIIDLGNNGALLRSEDNCLYVAGQTAPSPGIWISGTNFGVNCNRSGGCDKIAFAHIGHFGEVMTSGHSSKGDIWLLGGGDDLNTNIALFNMSGFWATDETGSISRNTQGVLWFQSILAEPLQNSGHPDSTTHNYIMLLASDSNDENVEDVSLQRNVFAHGRSRQPLTSTDDFHMSNNVIYNWQSSATRLRAKYAAEHNIEGNLYIAGPDTGSTLPITESSAGLSGAATVYIAGNCAVGFSDSTQSQLFSGFPNESSRIANAHPPGVVVDTISGCSTQSEKDFADLVMDCAGPRPAERAGAGATEITDMLATITARLNNTGGQGAYIQAGDISAPVVTVNTVDHTAVACPGGTTIPTADPNGTGAGIYINKALSWAQCHHENVTPAKCGQVAP